MNKKLLYAILSVLMTFTMMTSLTLGICLSWPTFVANAEKADETTLIEGLEVKMNKAVEGNELSSLFEFEDQEEMLLKVPEGAPYTAKLLFIRYNTGLCIYDEGADWVFTSKTKIKKNEPYIVRVRFQAKDGYKLDLSSEGEHYVESMKVTGLETGKGKDIEIWNGSAYSIENNSKEIDFVYSLGISKLGLYPSISPEIGKAVTITYATSYTDTAYWIAGATGPFEYKLVVAPIGTEVQTINVFGKSTCYVQLTATNAMSGGTLIIRATATDGQTIDLPIKVNAVSNGHKHTYGEFGLIDYKYHGRTTCTDPDCPGIAPAFDEGAEYAEHNFQGGCTKVCIDCGDVDNPDGTHNFKWEYYELDKEYHYKKCACGEIEKDKSGDEIREKHYGGKANCYFGASCEACNRIYTEKGNHKYEFVVPVNTMGNIHHYICALCGDNGNDIGTNYIHEPEGGIATCAHRAVCTYEKNGVKCGLEYGDYVDHTFISGKCHNCGTSPYIKDIEITIPDWVEYGSINALKVPIINKGKIYTDANSTWFGYTKNGTDPNITKIDNNIIVSYHFFAQANCNFIKVIDMLTVTINGNGEFYEKRLMEEGKILEIKVLLRHPEVVQKVSLDFGVPMEAHNVSDLKVIEKNGLEVVSIQNYYGYGKFVKDLNWMLYVTLKAPNGKRFEKPLSYEEMLCNFEINGAEFYQGERAKISEDGTLFTVLVRLSKTVECDHKGAALVEGKAPTCTENGVIDKFVCPYCEKAFKDVECTEVWNESERIIFAAGHKYDKGSFKFDKISHYHVCETCSEKVDEDEHKPDRTEATEKLPVKCIVCEYVITPVLGHTHHLTLVPGTEATCETEGTKTYYTCDGCSEKFEDEAGTKVITTNIEIWSIIPMAHKFGKWIEEVPATKKTTGIKAHKDCEFCGKHFDDYGNEIADLTISKFSSEEEVDESKQDGLSDAAIICIIVGSVIVVSIGGFALFWFAIKKKSFADLIATIKGNSKKK